MLIVSFRKDIFNYIFKVWISRYMHQFLQKGVQVKIKTQYVFC
mgnify:CR=1 FL=1